MLFQAAKSIIAQYLAIGYARLFAFPGSSAGPPAPDIQSGAGFGLGNAITTGIRTAASGKGALMNQPYLVGERGPELFVPKGNGTIVPSHQMGSGASVTVNVDALVRLLKATLIKLRNLARQSALLCNRNWSSNNVLAVYLHADGYFPVNYADLRHQKQRTERRDSALRRRI